MKNRLIFPVAAILLFAGLHLSSCKKPTEELGPMREFMTSAGISVKSGQTQAVLSWREAVNTDSTKSTYTVEVSQDSSFISTAKFTYVVSGISLTVTDSQLIIREKYYARVKTNGKTPEQDSKWVKSNAFSLTGEQIFLAVKDNETKHNSVILHWVDSTKPLLTKIVLTPQAGSPIEVPLDQVDLDSSFKKIEGLSPSTKYHAQIFTATKEKGYIDFTTKDVPVYAYTINPTMDLSAVLDTCAASIIIGLDTGTYLPTATCNLKGKSVTLMSVSGNPDDTKVVFKEFKLMGDGAGLVLRDISFDGAGTALYFLNFAGLASDAAAANFANVSLENCRVSNYGNCLLRANRGAAAGDHKIGSITFNNCIFYNNLLTNLYTEFTLDKLTFQNFTVTNSTFATVGRAILGMGTALPAGTPIPVVLFDHNTINNFGTGTNRVLMDANTNPVQATFTNNIFANTPRTSTLNNELLRATGVGSTVVFSFNNYFKLTNGSAVILTIPTYVTQAGVQQVDLGWLPATTDFKLAASSPMQTAGSTGGPIGDPRWH
jgi:hypothetical protein